MKKLNKKHIILLLGSFVVVNFAIFFRIFAVSAEENYQTFHLDITNVTVYPKGAKLTGSVPLSLKKGDTTIVLEGIPEKIAEKSIKVYTEADVNIAEISFNPKKSIEKSNQKDLKLSFK